MLKTALKNQKGSNTMNTEINVYKLKINYE